MERIERTDAPGWLVETWRDWGKEWAEKLNNNKKASFTWHRHNKKGRKELEKALCSMTDNHCSFCDSYPMGARLKPTIEHFRPKSKFPELAYQWENLFMACFLCQEKGDAFSEMLLKPDEESYSFDEFFDIDWATGELIPNMNASKEDQERARITIELYRLNKNGKPEDRLEELEKYRELEAYDIERFSYRFFLKRGFL